MRLTVYLHPDRGPISPLHLDLLDVFRTWTQPRPADGLQRRELDLLCAAIRKSYPLVRPESNLDGLRRIYASFGHADRFDGVVLRVAGEIAAPAAAADPQVDEIRAEIKRCQQESRRLQGELRGARQADAGQRELVRGLTARLERAQAEVAAARQEAEGLRAGRDELRAERDQLRAERDLAARAIGQLQATLAARDELIEELRAERREPGGQPPVDDLMLEN